MKSDMTLTRRFVLYLAAIISVLLIGSLIVISAVVRSAFTDLFSERLSRSRQALADIAKILSCCINKTYGDDSKGNAYL